MFFVLCIVFVVLYIVAVKGNSEREGGREGDSVVGFGVNVSNVLNSSKKWAADSWRILGALHPVLTPCRRAHLWDERGVAARRGGAFVAGHPVLHRSG